MSTITEEAELGSYYNPKPISSPGDEWMTFSQLTKKLVPRDNRKRGKGRPVSTSYAHQMGVAGYLPQTFGGLKLEIGLWGKVRLVRILDEPHSFKKRGRKKKLEI